VRERDAGVSLPEVLVALAIVGVMAGAALLGLGTLGRGPSGEAEAMRLADRLQLAADEAIVASVPLAMVWDERGYRFVAWDGARATWRVSGQRDLGTRHELPAALRLTRDGADGRAPVMIAPDLPRAAVLRVAGSGVAWRVDFDGLGASVTAIGR
jgi:type II secretion system protein H